MSSMVVCDERVLRARAKSRIMNWFDKLSAPRRAREVFSRSTNAVLAELPNRDTSHEVVTVALGDTRGLDIALRGDSWRIFPCADTLAIATVVPGWAKGWRSVISDDVSYDQLTWFLHYARQYIHRSHVAKLLMTAWDRDARVLHPFGPAGMSRYYGAVERAPTVRAMLGEAVTTARAEWGYPTSETTVRSVWSDVNTLDPSIHQAIFHFIRAQGLLRHGFELEAVVGFDCAFQALKTMLVGGRLAKSATSRGDLCVALGLGSRAAAVATEGHFLRNMVGAHAGGWRWWDSGEVTEGLVPELSRVVRRALGRASAMEPGIRRVDPSPERWSGWFLANFDMLWDVVWFDR